MALEIFKILSKSSNEFIQNIITIKENSYNFRYQEQQSMVKKVLVMRQQHCGTPYQTMQGVFPLLGSSQFSSLTGISQKICTCSSCKL